MIRHQALSESVWKVIGILPFTSWDHAGNIPTETQSHLHWWVFVIGRSTRGQLDGRDPKTPDVSFEIVATDLRRWETKQVVFLSFGKPTGRKEASNQPPTCSMTSGAIQHGVPTNVFRTLFLVMSPPVAKKALTPKSRREIFKKKSIYTSQSQIKSVSTSVRLKKEQNTKQLPAICTEPSSPRRIFPALRSLREEQECR